MKIALFPLISLSLLCFCLKAATPANYESVRWSLINDSSQCPDSNNFTLNVNPNGTALQEKDIPATSPQPPCVITVTANVTANEPCNGDALGSATSTIIGGTAPFTYNWTPAGGTNATATALSAGTYIVSIQDNNGCTGSATVTITQPPVLTATITANTQVLCSGGTNGSATVTAGGGTPAYTYSWVPGGQTTATATGLGANDYTVTVTDNNGCTATAEINITQPQPLTVFISVITPALCSNNNGSATATAVFGAGAYTYSWAPNGGTNAVGTGFSAGTFTVTVTDGNGCTATASATITQTPGITVTVTASTNLLCNGGSNGSATIVASAGLAPYTYAWTPNGGTNTTATGLSAGTYTITVRDANNCSGTATVTITQPPPITLNTSITQANCGNSDGSATIAAAGGTPAYTYLWTPSGNTNITATGLSAGTYTITVTDHNGCTQTSTATVTTGSNLTASISSSTNILCNGGATGSATVTAAGGAPPYTYTWTPAGGTNAAATGLSAATYTVTVTDNGGCTATASITITQPTLLTATMGVSTNVFCNGGATGSATVTAAGGTPAYTYIWTPVGGTTATGTGLSAATYTITVTDTHGCTATSAVIITQPAPITVTTTTTQATCGNSNGSATAIPAGGTPTYTYLWTPSGNTNLTATGLSAGTYTITVTDHNGCTQTSTATVTSSSNVSATITASTNLLCNGAATGSATITAVGGAAPYTYLWNPSANTNVTATGLSAATYTVTVTDNNGCTTTASVTITQPALLAATIGVPINELCNGATNGSVTVTAAGGNPAYTYAWTPVGGTNTTATGLSAATYTVTVTDNNGCTATSTVTITQPALLTATIGVPVNVLCNGGSTGSATITAAGGTPAYTYAWTPIGGTTATAIGLSVGSYTVNVTDNNGCTATSAVNITQPTPITLNTTTTLATCGNSNGSATVAAAGGTPAYTYLWTPSANTNITATGLSAGIYTITVKDNNGCTQTSTATVNSPSSVTASITASTNILCNGGTSGSATVTAAGGAPAYTYNWAPAGGTNAIATGLSAATYTVTVTDNSGCTATASVAITQPTLLTATMGVPTNILCNGGNTGSATVTVAGGTPTYTYAWTPVGGTNATGTGLSADTYTVTVTDNNGCTTTSTVTITQPALLTANITATNNVSCGGGNNGSLAVTAIGGTAPYTYAWTPIGGTNAIANSLSAGIYTITVTDANGCTATTTGTIAQPNVMTITTTSTQTSCINIGTATVTAAGGAAPYTYSWNPSLQTNATATALSAGTYTITITDNNNCTQSTTVIVTSINPVTATMGAIVNTTCFGGNNGTATVTAANGTAPYTYDWIPAGGAGAMGTGLSAGTYTVTVTDFNGCTATASAIIGQPNAMIVTATGTSFVCSGQPVILDATVAGGTAPYTYAWTPLGGNASTATVSPLTTTIYTVTITDASGCTATTTFKVATNPPLNVTIIGSASFCPGGSATLTASASGGDGVYTFHWLPGNSSAQSITVSPTSTTTYIVELTDACGSNMATANTTVSINPLPSTNFEANPASGCAPLCVLFRNLTTISSGSIAQWEWNFGNGSTSSSRNPGVSCYSDTGKYTVSLTAISDSGCSKTLQISDLVNVHPLPHASFTYSPQPIEILNPTVQFTSTSSGRAPLVFLYWSFGDGSDSTSSQANPTHTYSDTGSYCATLIVVDKNGCTDSVTDCFAVNPEFAFYIPDAFTPNGDNLNDVFMPKGNYVKDYEMYIYDRWGKKLFYSNNMNIGWAGTTGSGTQVCQEDAYVYLINVTDSQGIKHSYTGKVNLMK